MLLEPLRRERQLIWILIVLMTSVLFLLRLGDRAVVSEEFRWAEIAREMQQSCDYLHPTINGKPYPDKPVGSYWLILAASQVTGGVNEYAARLPSAIAGILGVIVVMSLGRRLYDDRTGLLAGVILATCYGFAFYARRATADVETVTGVLLAIWLYERKRDSVSSAWVVALWIEMALVSLTKGLLGFVLPIVVMSVDGMLLAWNRRPRPWSTRQFISECLTANRWGWNRWSIVAIPLGIGLYLLPFILASNQSGDTSGLEMVWRENIQRFVNPHNHVGPVYLYLYVIFLLAAPWSLFLPAALLQLLIPPTGGRGVRGEGDLNSHPLTPSPSPTRGEGSHLAIAYFWGIFIFFTLSASRRSYYLLPILPVLAIMVSRLLLANDLTPLLRRLRSLAWLGAIVAYLLIVMALIPTAWWLPAPYNQLPEIPGRAIALGFWVLGWIAIFFAIRRQQYRIPLICVMTFTLMGYIFHVVYPALEDVRPRNEFLNDVRLRTQNEPEKLGLFHSRDVIFDLGFKVREFESSGEISEAIQRGETRWIIVPKRRLSEITVPVVPIIEEAVLPWEPEDRRSNKLILLQIQTPPR